MISSYRQCGLWVAVLRYSWALGRQRLMFRWSGVERKYGDVVLPRVAADQAGIVTR